MHSALCYSPSFCLSVHLSHGWISRKCLKLGLWNFHHTVAPFSSSSHLWLRRTINIKGMTTSWWGQEQFGDSKGAFHQLRSNLGSAEPGSTLIVDLNQVQVMMRSTNVKLGSVDVVQLNHDGYTSWTLIGPICSRLVTSRVLFTLVLRQERP